jgi:putative endonuclease
VSIQKFYIGQTNDINQRLKRHNAGSENFTAKGIPWKLVWYTSKDSRSEAIILERKLKNLKQSRLIRFMNKYSDGIQNLQIIDMLEK